MANETILTGDVVSSTPSYTIYIVICLIILMIVGGFIMWRRMRKNRVPKEIPSEVLKEFNRAEELALKYKGSVTPQAILWQVNEERKNLCTLQDNEYENTQVHNIGVLPQPESKPKFKLKFKWK